MRFLIGSGLAAFLILSGGVSQGALITFEFSGEVTSLMDSGRSLGDLVKVGDTFTATYTFDSSAPDLAPGNALDGEYDASVAAMIVTVGSLTLVSGTSNLIQVNNYPTSDSISFSASNFDSSDIHVSGMELYLLDSSAAALTSDALPVQPLRLTDFDIARFQIEGDAFGNPLSFTIDGVLLPEPGSLSLILGGAVLLRRRTRR